MLCLALAGLADPVKSEGLEPASLHELNSPESYSMLRNYVASIERRGPKLAAAGTPGSAKSGHGAYSRLRKYIRSAEQSKAAKLVVAEAPPSPATATGEPPHYVGSETCLGCHESSGSTFGKTLMGMIFMKQPRNSQEKLGCEACHGPGSAHVAAEGIPDQGDPGGLIGFGDESPRPVAERNAVCLGCHQSGMQTHWQGSTHEARGLACTSCHQVMEKVSPRNNFVKATQNQTCFQCHKDRRAQLYRSSHMPQREGKIQCSDCHNPHGSVTEKLLKTSSVNENCYQCHAEKRGPFLFEHPPARENCMNCHKPHGSIHRSLLRVSLPRLCQQCHSEANHPGVPRNQFDARFALNRGCVNCHQPHGSNHPSGVRFHR